jgi:Protein of unknown function (DUF5131)
MAATSAIEWTDATWNPIVGCTRVSEGCRNCYAERLTWRRAHMGVEKYQGLTKRVGGAIRWTGEVRLVHEALVQPLRWWQPKRIFVNSMSDLYHEKVRDAWLTRIFDVMVRADWHTFQILTKRRVSKLDTTDTPTPAETTSKTPPKEVDPRPAAARTKAQKYARRIIQLGFRALRKSTPLTRNVKQQLLDLVGDIR